MPDKFDNSFKLNEEQIAALKRIVPEAFKDGLVDIGALSDALSDYSGDDTLDIDENLYGLYWPGKRAAKRAAAIPPIGTLAPILGDGVDEDTTRNIYIEGDNLETLKLLKKAYEGRIKMIYIDPPYNTGGDFIYNDDYSETAENFQMRMKQINAEGIKQTTNNKSDGRFHSKWLSMMYPRLRLSHDLLSEDGVIFISIDDNEVANLQNIMDEVFGTSNFVGHIAWESKTKSQNTIDAFNKLQPRVEHILVYTKEQLRRFNLIQKGKKDYPEQDERGEYRWARVEQMNANGIRGRETMVFSILGQLPLPERQWQLGFERIQGLIAMGDCVLKEGVPFIKVRPADERNEVTEPFWAFFSKEMGTAESAKKELTSIIGKHGFETVKPIEVIKRMIFHSTASVSIILDFFSGSATTAHAVMKLNSEDGGNRQFIMIQIPEICGEKSESAKAGFKNICEIGKERIRRAGKKIKEEAGLDAQNLDVGFKVFRLVPSNFKPVGPYTGTDIKELPDWFAGDPLVDGWKPENLIVEVMLKEGFPLDSAIVQLNSFKKNKVYRVSSESCGHSLIICFDKNIENDTIEKLDLGELNIFICLDSAVTDQVKARLDDKGQIITI